MSRDDDRCFVSRTDLVLTDLATQHATAVRMVAARYRFEVVERGARLLVVRLPSGQAAYRLGLEVGALLADWRET